MFEENCIQIQKVIENYFYGVFDGNIEKLRKVFHPKALLIGDINGESYFKTLAEYLEGVKDRKSPKELNESFNMKIISLEILGNNAIAKLNVPIFGYNYYDLMSLSKINDNWVIVNKLFTNIEYAN